MTRTVLALALFVLVALPAGAHDFWIEPSTFRPAPGTEVTAALRIGQKLEGEPLPRDPRLVDRFVLRSAAGETPVGGMPGDEPAGTVRVAGPGPQWIGYQSRPYPVRLEAAAFEGYLKEEGLEQIVGERARTGRSAAPGRERFSRCAKALLDVAGGPTASAASLGFTLELVPLKSPYALSPGANLPISLSFRGKPLANALVVAISKAEPGKAVSARTDSNGVVKLTLTRPGVWLVKAVHMEAAPPDAGVDWESWWASVTFDLASAPRK